jgi:hypothetical protein
MNRTSFTFSVIAALAVALMAPGCSPTYQRRTYDIWHQDTLDVGPKRYWAACFVVEDAFRTAAPFEDSVTLHVSFDVLDWQTLACYVVTVPNFDLWVNRLPFEALDSQAYLPATHGADFLVPRIPNDRYYIILDNRGDTTLGRTVLSLRCELTYWEYIGRSLVPGD